MLDVPLFGLFVALGPGHWSSDHPLGKGLWDAVYGQPLALSWIHQDVVHYTNVQKVVIFNKVRAFVRKRFYTPIHFLRAKT